MSPDPGSAIAPSWALFPHDADIGVRGIGATREAAFEQAALALSAAVTGVDAVVPQTLVELDCEAPSDALLFVDWLNALIFEMAERKMVFGRFAVEIVGSRLHGRAWGEAIDRARHAPAVEPKGATYTALALARRADGAWVAQCVVDV
ncbi:MAG: archease [Pseudomonadota bacterium]